ncbi:MAG TPA: chorismate mutase [Thermoleophilia bacterium]|nr:chorismate mutase [Thermoleophilia bacterium]HQG03523.1 chorismate mutase [Thermoleophilia bacterium]HQG54557.1 chorismate mutase [Thermoleophilia bacterium]
MTMPHDTPPRLRALRGATTVETDTSEAILERTAELVRRLLERNELPVDDVVSVLFSATPDLTADFPAVAARSVGLSSTPLLCCQEIAVAGAVERCVRVLMHCYLGEARTPHHVYLHGARRLRLDLPE